LHTRRAASSHPAPDTPRAAGRTAPRDGPGPGRRPSGPTARSPRPSRGPPRSSRTPRGPAAWPARSAGPAGHADRAPIPAAPATPDHQTDRSPPGGSHRPDMPRAGQRTGTAKMDRRARHSDDHELRELHDLPASCSFVTPDPPVTTASNPVKHGTPGALLADPRPAVRRIHQLPAGLSGRGHSDAAQTAANVRPRY
jgi:hypothetical protein